MTRNIFLIEYLKKNLLNKNKFVLESKFKFGTKLVEVGKLQVPKKANYVAGQLFLHKVLAYRGVILFPWVTKFFDMDTPVVKQESVVPERRILFKRDKSLSIPVKGLPQTCYQVLIDSRDWPYIKASLEAVTFLDLKKGSKDLFTIPGLDHVSHEDILPYSSTDKEPIHHELFNRFLAPAELQEPPFTSKDSLKTWERTNLPWLKLSTVSKQTTENIRVTVTPFYMGCKSNLKEPVYWWRYSVRIENLGNKTVQLKERHWSIHYLPGRVQNVSGSGVVSQEPILTPASPVFQYSSHINLRTPSGRMCGNFKMQCDDGSSFHCRIPMFSLDSEIDGADLGPPSFGA